MFVWTMVCGFVCPPPLLLPLPFFFLLCPLLAFGSFVKLNFIAMQYRGANVMALGRIKEGRIRAYLPAAFFSLRPLVYIVWV